MKRSLISASLAFTALLVMPLSAIAADGTWTFAGGGSWDTPSNWSDDTIADGAGSTATFTTGTTGTFAITLDTSRTVGSLTFGNHAWQLNGSDILTLSSGSTPLITVSSQSAAINTQIAGTQGFQTSGTLTLGGANTYTGTTNIGFTGNTSTVTLNNNGALGATGLGNDTVVANGSTLILANGVTITGETVSLGQTNSAYGNLQATGTAEWAGNVLINHSNARIGTTNAASQLTVSGSIQNGTSNNLIISATPGSTVVLSGVNTYTGTSLIYRGTLKLDGGNNRLPTGTAFSLGGTGDNSTLDLNGQNQQLAQIISFGTQASTRTITNSASSTASILTLSSASDASFLGTGSASTFITGNLSIVKAGTFNQTLANTNTYTGDTTINAGTITLADDATMTFFIGANGVNNQILGTGNLALNGDFIFDLSGADATDGNSWLIADFAHLNQSIGSTFTVQGFTKTGDNWTFGDYTFSETSGILSYGTLIPEPSTAAALTGLAALGLVTLRRRRDLA